MKGRSNHGCYQNVRGGLFSLNMANVLEKEKIEFELGGGSHRVTKILAGFTQARAER